MVRRRGQRSGKTRSKREERERKRAEWLEFHDEFQKESDRACTILGAEMLSEQLRVLFERFFVEDPIASREVLEGGGLARSFHARIRLAYVLGFLPSKAVLTLDAIRDVRNAFAHDLHDVTFQTPAVASLCQRMSGFQWAGRPRDMPARTPRELYIEAVMILGMTISTRASYLPDTERRQVPSRVL